MGFYIRKSHIIYTYYLYEYVKKSILDTRQGIEKNDILVCCLCITLKYLEDGTIDNIKFIKFFRYYINIYDFNTLELLILDKIYKTENVNLSLYKSPSDYLNMFTTFQNKYCYNKVIKHLLSIIRLAAPFDYSKLNFL